MTHNLWCYNSYLVSTKKAENAIKAAKNLVNWGWYATHGFCKNQGVPIQLFIIAYSCEYPEYMSIPITGEKYAKL